MVLTQPKDETDLSILVHTPFPYHYGSYATKGLLNGVSDIPWFPYHYGSYATLGCEALSSTVFGGFHTTMVLTQQTFQK